VSSSAATNERGGADLHVAGWYREVGFILAVTALVAVAVVAELLGSIDGWVLDLAAGLVVGMGGLVVIRRRAHDVVGWLLLAASIAWFAGTLASAEGWLARLGRDALFVHRGLLLVALVVPLWRAGTTRGSTTAWRAVVVAVAVGAAVVSVGSEAGSVRGLGVVAAVTIGAAIAGMVAGVLVPWPAMWVLALPATLMWCAAASSLERVEAFSPSDRLVVYQYGVAAAAAFMAASRFDRRPVAEQVVEVGRRAGLGGALDDPGLRIGFRDGATFRAADGSTVAPTGGQQSTELDLGPDTPRVLIVHQTGLLDDPRVRADVVVAARLLAENHRLIREVERQAANVEESRARLLASDTRATAEFGLELETRVLAHLDEVAAGLDQSRPDAEPALTLASNVRCELAALADGYAPATLADGLVAAILVQAASFPLPVELEIPPVEFEFDDAVERDLFFVTAEALSNVLKHSEATAVCVRLQIIGPTVELSIEDDGLGGVAVRPGGGLAGLADRLVASGGSLECHARTPTGTAVVARLPFGAVR
jgi:hypothetical protein